VERAQPDGVVLIATSLRQKRQHSLVHGYDKIGAGP